MNRCCMRAICSASGRGVLIKAGGGVSAGSGRFSVLSCSGSPLPVDDAEVVLAPTGVGGASPSAEVDGLSLSDRAAPALCTSAVGCPANLPGPAVASGRTSEESQRDKDEGTYVAQSD